MSKTRQSFPLTPLLYIWILLHCVVLMVGAKYTYAEVPLFDWISEIFGWERNNYDKVGHFMQGLVPALIAREIFLGKEGSGQYEWLAKFYCPFHLLGIHRLLRIDRMVGGFADRRGCGCLPRRPGIHLGHTVRYGARPTEYHLLSPYHSKGARPSNQTIALISPERYDALYDSRD